MCQDTSTKEDDKVRDEENKADYKDPTRAISDRKDKTIHNNLPREPRRLAY